ncbi:hypothetical protein PPERSA_00935 [Pseudocohnilembus persalinus]|uniref:Uncharacterized protein n=1 Tax=Pseudocohnilembus persalinus TaxID=266149 RepID=A0A0V0QET8_PSEPJ|nr:hypothetical protein PPERSA_00935 [Pseudocohnilembus persalinus]|eukprot:KRX00708.1 hypothetical protein PPERSA_00935 [Pseudocohnilembus persalinus]
MQSLGIQPQELNIDSDQEDEAKEEKDKNQQNKTQFLSSKMLTSARLGLSPLKRPSRFGGLKSQINLENQLKESVNLLHKQENSNFDQNLDQTPQEKTKPLESPWIKHDLMAGKIQEQPEEDGDDSLMLINSQEQLKEGESEEIISGFKLQKVLIDSEQPINQQQKRQNDFG